MPELDDYQHQQLTGLSECYIHTHPREPLNQTSWLELESSSTVKPVTGGAYSPTAADEQLAIGQTCTVTLPTAASGKEYHITLTASGATLTINPTAPDTIMGDTSLVATIQWTSLHLKADTGNWILI